MTSQNLIAPVLLFLFSAILQAGRKETSINASYRFAKILETHFPEMRDSSYQHKTEISEKLGTWNCDYSALIRHILRRHFPRGESFFCPA